MTRLFLVVLLFLAGSLDAVGQTEIAVRPDDVPYSFIAEVATYDGTEDSVAASFQARLLVDPTRPAGQRVSVLGASDVRDLAPIARTIKTFESGQIADAFWCGVPAGRLTDARLVSTDGSLVVFELAQDDSAARIGVTDADEGRAARKAAKHLKGTLTIDTTSQSVVARDSWLERGFKPNLVSRVSAITGHRTCALAPNGQAYAATSRQHVSASAVGVIDIDRVTIVAITELIPLRRAGLSGQTMTDVTP